MFVPGVFEKVFSAQETGLRSHQRLEYSKFFGLKIEGLTVSCCTVAQGVELYPAGPINPLADNGAAAGKSTDPQHELWEMEGLGQVVVRTDA
jgi:hypothetical protein